MRKLSVFLLLLMLMGLASGAVQHRIYADNEKALVNTTVQLSCNPAGSGCPVNYWTLSWSKPPGSEILSIRDSLGPVEEYTVSGEQIRITTNTGIKRTNETVEIRLLIRRDAEEIHAGLHKRTFSLPGFNSSRTSGIVKAPDLVSGRTSFGFESGFSTDEMTFAGRGPVNLRIKTGDGNETRYFSFFGSRADENMIAYEVPVGTTGLVQGFERFPVAVMDDATYDRKVNSWSAGEYFSGTIQIRSQESLGEDFKPVLAHEVVHGLNDRELNWDQTSSSYFDEGAAKYVEFLVKRKLYREGRIEKPPAELFGDKVRYDPDPTDRSYYTVPPQGNRESLWNYYQEGGDFMKTWSALDSSPENRGFGYAYSELIIRKYIVEGGSLRQLYRDIDVGRKVNSPERKWEIYSRHLDMTPCKYSSRERFESCLEEINSHEYPVYSASPSRSTSQLEVKKLEIPNRTSELGNSSPSFDGDISFRQFVGQFIDYWISRLRSLIRSVPQAT